MSYSFSLMFSRVCFRVCLHIAFGANGDFVVGFALGIDVGFVYGQFQSSSYEYIVDVVFDTVLPLMSVLVFV